VVISGDALGMWIRAACGVPHSSVQAMADVVFTIY